MIARTLPLALAVPVLLTACPAVLSDDFRLLSGDDAGDSMGGGSSGSSSSSTSSGGSSSSGASSGVGSRDGGSSDSSSSSSGSGSSSSWTGNGACTTNTACGEGCENCTTKGATCNAHSNGVGQTFYDCNPLGTYNQTQATKACAALTGNASQCAVMISFRCQLGLFGNLLEVCSTGSAGCYCWQWSVTPGSVASPSSSCPVCAGTSPTWN